VLAVNRHDIWSLHGPPPRRERLPMILGTDAAGVDRDGRAVIAYPVIGDYGGRWTMPSEEHPGTLAERVALPATALLELPPELSFEQAACLPTAYLTAFRMLFRCGRVGPGDRVLGAIAPGERLRQRVDAVIETVGAATWSHSVKSLRPGGTLVISGATSGPNPKSAELNRIFFLELKVVGSTMGTKDDLAGLLDFCAVAGVRPVIDSVLPLDRAREGFEHLARGEVFGKIVLTS
jgi:NADPH:quinone reductase-like Zn-dependent oxidoreductase